MKDVTNLLKQRDKLYRDQTVVAFDSVSPALMAIEDYLISVDPSYGFGIFEWEEIAIYKDDKILMLLGIVNYEPDQEFLMGADMVQITADNKDYFQRVLRIGIPLSVIAMNDKDAVTEFLINLNSTAVDEDVPEIEPIKLKPDENAVDFDLDDLTEEQREALMHHDLGKIN